MENYLLHSTAGVLLLNTARTLLLICVMSLNCVAIATPEETANLAKTTNLAETADLAKTTNLAETANLAETTNLAKTTSLIANPTASLIANPTASLIADPTASLIADPIAGKAKAEKCVACHNADGNSTVALWPKLAGQHQSYLFSQLLAFQQGANGGRNEPSMYAMVQGLSQQDLADLSAFYAKQTISAGSAKANLVAMGQALYRGGNMKTGLPACAACHGANGMGNEQARFPRIAGQHAEYTASQLQNYKKKVRTNDINGIMQDIANKLSDAEIEALSSYIEGLH